MGILLSYCIPSGVHIFHSIPILNFPLSSYVAQAGFHSIWAL